MIEDRKNPPQFDLTDFPPQTITVSVSNPTQVKTTISSYTVYKITGSDRQGEFECTRRYSDFDHLRLYLLKRWPGCFIPPLPRKKLVGNTDADFVEIRKQGLNYFCLQMSELRHLWYSDEFQTFIRKNGDVDVVSNRLMQNLKGLGNENHEEIIKKYDEKLPKLSGKCSDTIVIAKVIYFNKYIKQMLPIIASYKAFLEGFIDAQRSNIQQYSLLFNYLLPEYERSCLTVFLNQNTDGKTIFIDETDDKLAQLINRMKQQIKIKNFERLYELLDLEERQLMAFLDTYKMHEQYELKLAELKKKQKDMEVEMSELNAGKQSLFKSIFKKGNIEESKKQLQRQMSLNKDSISTYGLLSDLIVITLGFFEIDRFKRDKIRVYKENITKVSKIQLQFADTQKKIFKHILDNHNLL